MARPAPRPSVPGRIDSILPPELICHAPQDRLPWPRPIRDEAKIADLKARLKKANEDADKLVAEGRHPVTNALLRESDWHQARKRAELLEAELHTAEAATPGHPLVNTTDQWTTTALRRLIKQAVDSGADKISIPSGATVHGYGMGDEPIRQVGALRYNPETKGLQHKAIISRDGKVNEGWSAVLGQFDQKDLPDQLGKELAQKLMQQPARAGDYGNWHVLENINAEIGGHGMKSFYNEIVPKNLRNILQRYDKDIKAAKVATMTSPVSGKLIGKGFTVFPITDKVRGAVGQGQPLFATGLPLPTPGALLDEHYGDDYKR